MTDVNELLAGIREREALSDAFLVDLWWETCDGVWAVPDQVMVAYGRAVLSAGFRLTPAPSDEGVEPEGLHWMEASDTVGGSLSPFVADEEAVERVARLLASWSTGQMIDPDDPSLAWRDWTDDARDIIAVIKGPAPSDAGGITVESINRALNDAGLRDRVAESLATTDLRPRRRRT